MLFQVKYKYLFEPYVIARKKDLPLYNEQFLGRFFDKLSHIQELDAHG